MNSLHLKEPQKERKWQMQVLKGIDTHNFAKILFVNVV